MPLKNWYQTFAFTPSTQVLVTALPDPLLTGLSAQSGVTVIPAAELPALVTAAEAADTTVRAAGSRWSSMDVMATPDTSVTLTQEGLHPMTRILGCSIGASAITSPAIVAPSPVLPGALSPLVMLTGKRLVHVEAGISVHQLLEFLALPILGVGGAPGKPAMTIPNMGASSGQRVAGAIATATHGGAFDRRPLADSVRAVRVVGPGGARHWIERAGTRAITVGAAMASALPGDQIWYDDELFLAAVVGVGALGIVIELVLEVAAEVGMSQRCVTRSWSDVRAAIASGDIFELVEAGQAAKHAPTSLGPNASLAAEGLEILINPYRTDDNYGAGPAKRDCRVVFRALRLGAAADPAPAPAQGLSTFDAVLAATLAGPAIAPILLGFAPLLGVTTVALYAAFEAGLLPVYRLIIEAIHQLSRSDTAGYPATHKVLETYDGSTPASPGLSLELAIPTRGDRHLAMLDEMLTRFDELIAAGHRYAGFFSIRFTQPSAAHLAMQREPLAVVASTSSWRICHVEVFGLNEINWGQPQVDGNMEGGTDRFVREFVKIGERHDARLHWGQTHHLDRHAVVADYGHDGLHPWRRARTRLCAGGGWRTFSNAHSRRTGLESYHEAIAAVTLGGTVDVLALDTGGRPWRRALGEVGPAVALTSVGFADVCGPITGVVMFGKRVAFAETVTRRIRSMRETGPNAWASDLLPDLGEHQVVTGPWSAVAVGSATHLFGVAAGGRIRWLRAAPFVAWQGSTLTPELPAGAGLFTHAVSACVDDAGVIHLVGLSDERQLVHGRYAAGVWTWSWLPVALQLVGNVPQLPILSGPVVVAANTADRLHVFGVSRDGAIYRIFGQLGAALAWETVPSLAVPAEPHTEIVPHDLLADDAYMVLPTELRTFAAPIGPLAVVAQGTRFDLVARTDTGAIIYITRPAGGGWQPPTRLAIP